MTIGSRIRSARKSAGMSQEELGNRLDIGKSSISEWESGKRALPIDVVEQISEILNVSVQYIMGWNEEPAIRKSTGLSPAALEVARHYDTLSETSQKLISAIVLFESADVRVKNQIISILVDHANNKLMNASPFDAVSDNLRIELESGPIADGDTAEG